MSSTSSNPALAALYEAGRRAFPELALSPEAFVERLAACGAPAAHADLGEARAADLFLACACAAGVRGAVEVFDSLHLSRVGVALERLRPSPELVDEVRQVLREKLFVGREGAAPKIAEYDGRGALASWVRVIALRAAIDLQRRGDVAAETDGAGEEPVTGDPEVDYLKRRYREAFNAAFRGAVEELGAEAREILRLHFIEGLTLEALAQRHGVHRATVARRIAAGRDAVAASARRRLAAALGASEAELESLIRVMRTELDASLVRLLGGGA